METENCDAIRTVAGLRKKVRRARFKGSRQNQTKPPLQDNRDDPSNLNKILDRICQIHSTPGKPSNHTHRDCWVFKQSGRLNAEHKGLDTPSEDEDEPQKQSTGKEKNFPQEVKTVNLLHITKRAAPIKVRAPRSIPKESRHWLSNQSSSIIWIILEVSGTQAGLPWYSIQ